MPAAAALVVGCGLGEEVCAGGGDVAGGVVGWVVGCAGGEGDPLGAADASRCGAAGDADVLCGLGVAEGEELRCPVRAGAGAADATVVATWWWCACGCGDRLCFAATCGVGAGEAATPGPTTSSPVRAPATALPAARDSDVRRCRPP